MFPRALTGLVRAHQGELVSHVSGRLRGSPDAEDVVQETWIRLGRVAAAEARGGPVITNARALLFRIARNLSIDLLRRRGVRRHLEAACLDAPEALRAADPAADAEAALILEEGEAAFEAALRRLPPRARQVLILSRIEGWSYPRIAERLGISLRTVSSDMEAALRGCLASLSRED